MPEERRTTNVEAVRDEHAIRHLVTRASVLREPLWGSRRTRARLGQALVTMYGERTARHMLFMIASQAHGALLRSLANALTRYSDGHSRGFPFRVFAEVVRCVEYAALTSNGLVPLQEVANLAALHAFLADAKKGAPCAEAATKASKYLAEGGPENPRMQTDLSLLDDEDDDEDENLDELLRRQPEEQVQYRRKYEEGIKALKKQLRIMRTDGSLTEVAKIVKDHEVACPVEDIIVELLKYAQLCDSVTGDPVVGADASRESPDECRQSGEEPVRSKSGRHKGGGRSSDRHQRRAPALKTNDNKRGTRKVDELQPSSGGRGSKKTGKVSVGHSSDEREVSGKQEFLDSVNERFFSGTSDEDKVNTSPNLKSASERGRKRRSRSSAVYVPSADAKESSPLSPEGPPAEDEIEDSDSPSEGRGRSRREMRKRRKLAIKLSPPESPEAASRRNREPVKRKRGQGRRGFSEREDMNIVAGLKKYGWGDWKLILSDYEWDHPRTNVNLKDRARAMHLVSTDFPVPATGRDPRTNVIGRRRPRSLNTSPPRPKRRDRDFESEDNDDDSGTDTHVPTPRSSSKKYRRSRTTDEDQEEEGPSSAKGSGVKPPSPKEEPKEMSSGDDAGEDESKECNEDGDDNEEAPGREENRDKEEDMEETEDENV